jgi:hypothetical protein
VNRMMLALVVFAAAAPAYAQPDEWSYGRRHDGVHLRILRDYHLPAGSSTNEPIVVLGGSATIDGRAEDDVVVVGGTLRVGPTAVVRGDLVAVGGEAIIDPAARVSGEVDETVIVWPDIDAALGRLPDGWWAVAAFGATLLRLGVALVFSLLLTLVAPGWIDGIARRAAASAGAAAVLGVAGQILFVPGIVVVVVALAISVIGIPLLAALPLLIGAAGVLWAAGFAAVSALVGSRLRGRATDASGSSAADVLTGFTAISLLTIAGHLMALGSGPITPLAWVVVSAGLLIEYLAWTVGLGAALTAAFSGRQRVTPPPMPLPAPAPTTP